MANKYLDLAGLKSYNGALLGTQIGSLVTYDGTKFVKTTFSYNSETGVVTKATADAIATNGSVASGNYALVTGDAVYQAIQGITEPMIFEGGATIGADGSITVTVPATATDIKKGFTYKITTITTGYSGTLKAGDTLIAAKNSPSVAAAWVENTDWVVVPSGDENDGTVTEVAAGVGLTTVSGSAISTSGTIKANLNSEDSLGTIGTTDKLYAVGVDSNNKLAVNVPWTDTTYTGTGAIDVTGTVISVATATDSTLGVVKAGTNVTIGTNADAGKINVATATDSVKGVVQVGTNLSVSDGVVSVATGAVDTSGSTPVTTLGVVAPDGVTIGATNGVLTVSPVETTDINALFTTGA